MNMKIKCFKWIKGPQWARVVPFSAGFRSVSWFPRLCLQTPGTSCRPSRKPDRLWELSPLPAGGQQQDSLTVNSSVPLIGIDHGCFNHNTLPKRQTFSVILRSSFTVNTRKLKALTHFSLSNTKQRCLLDSESLQMKVNILLSVLSSAQKDIRCNWQLCCTSWKTKTVHSLFMGVTLYTDLFCLADSLLSWDLISSRHKWRSVIPL